MWSVVFWWEICLSRMDQFLLPGAGEERRGPAASQAVWLHRNPLLVLHHFGRSDPTSGTWSTVEPFHQSLMWVMIRAQKLHVDLLFSIAFAGNKTQEKKRRTFYSICTLKKQSSQGWIRLMQITFCANKGCPPVRSVLSWGKFNVSTLVEWLLTFWFSKESDSLGCWLLQSLVWRPPSIMKPELFFCGWSGISKPKSHCY